MNGYNQVIVMGNLTRDPELRYTAGGAAVCNFSVAVNSKWKNAQGEMKENVEYIELEAWRKTAEVISEHLTKGSPIFAVGRLKTTSWEQKIESQPDPIKRKKTMVVVDRFNFIGSKRSGGHEVESVASAETEESPAATDDDIPF